MPTVLRFKELEPSWAVPRATEPGFMRWLVSWLGGPAGYVNFNPGLAAASRRAAMGFMAMPHGNRQAGLHKHTVTEIYVILQGEIEGYDHTGHTHVAGPLDCIYIPAGVPHGVRTRGTQDLHLVWVHDAIERVGLSVYVDSAQPSDSDRRISIVRGSDLDPWWDAPRAREGGFLRWSISYVGDRPAGVPNEFVSLGMTWILPGNRDDLAPLAHARTLLLVRGGAVARVGLDHGNTELSYMDAIHLPAGEALSLRALGDVPAGILWLAEGAP
jgi:mannose-6-phosphate isomerase-like protein (cupin superfamily)